jgi:hypothetical protein
MAKTIAMLLMALALAVGGVALARYADVDDSPGGMMFGGVMVLGAVVLGAKAFLRKQS